MGWRHRTDLKEGLAVTYRRFQYEMRRKPDINTDGCIEGALKGEHGGGMYHSMIKSFSSFLRVHGSPAEFLSSPRRSRRTWSFPSEFGKVTVHVSLNLAMIGVLAGLIKVSRECSMKRIKKRDRAFCGMRSSRLCFFAAGSLCFFSLSAGLKYRVSSSEESIRSLVVILLSFNLFISIFERFSVLVLRMKKRGLAFSALRIVWALANSGGIVFLGCYRRKKLFGGHFRSVRQLASASSLFPSY